MAKVLVVDDICDVADSFAELLTLFGHQVRVAYSAAHATQEIDLCAPDVVLLDINMPVVDGFQLARQVRDRLGPRIRLIALTAYPRVNVAADLLEAGFDAFISKSARPLELAFAIQGRPGVFDLRTQRDDRRKSPRIASAMRRSSDSNTRLAA